MVFGRDGMRHVLLPAPENSAASISNRSRLHAEQRGCRDPRSVHQLPFSGPGDSSDSSSSSGLAERGEAGQAAMIEHQARMGNLLQEISCCCGLAHGEHTPLPLVCFTRDGLDVPKFLSALREHQVAWMSETGDQRETAQCVRASPVSKRTKTISSSTVDRITQLALKDGYAVTLRPMWEAGPNSSNHSPTCHQTISNTKTMKPETIAIHAGYEPERTTRSVAVPIYQTVSYAFDSAEHAAALFNLEAEGYRYTRIANPTTDVLERRVAALEGGFGALCVSSGQAAVYYALANVTQSGRNIVHGSPALRNHAHLICASSSKPRRKCALCRVGSSGRHRKGHR